MRWRATVRRYRTIGWSRRIWARRLAFLAGAIAVGLGAVLFAWASDGAHEIYRLILDRMPLALLVITPAGFALAAWLTTRFFDGAQGSGIPQAMAARRSNDPAVRARLLSARVTIGKLVLTVFGLAIGASIGREGPTVQLGAAIMYAIGGVAGLGRRNGLVLAGAAAGIAGAFNAPLAGVMFAIEELAKTFERRITSLIVAAVVIAGLTSLILVGDYRYFGRFVAGTVSTPVGWLAIVFCGVVGGGCGAGFAGAVVGLSRAVSRLGLKAWRRIAVAAACGLIVAVLALSTDGFAGGSGYAETAALLQDGAIPPIWHAPAKFVASILSSIAGIPGGLFAPSLAVGATLGGSLGPLLPGVDVRVLALLGMVGYFAGVVQAPLTAFVIVIEMTDQQGLVVPLMAAALIGAGISRALVPVPLYHALSHAFDRKPPISRPEP